MRGNLSKTRLPALIRHVYAARGSGILHLSSPAGSRRIFFRDGRIVLVESDVESDRFGESLVATGRIQRAHLNSALELATRERTNVGNALVKMKHLSAEEVKEQELRRMNEIIYSLLVVASGDFRFDEAENPIPEEAAYDIPAEQVILSGVRRITGVAVLLDLVGDLRTTLRLTESSPLPLFQIKLTPAERGLLQAIRERQGFNAKQLIAGSHLSEIETLRAVYALISVGILEAEGEASSPAGDTLEESRAASAEQVPKPDAPVGDSVPLRVGRFEIQRLLARGSMGEVFRGRDPDNDRIVAIKLLQIAAALEPAAFEEYVERFHRGAEAARQLYHPAIAAIWESGLTDENCPFLVSEYIMGTTLRDLLSSGPLAMKHALEIATQVLDGLAHAHSRGIVHRRFQPSHVLVTRDGRVKIKDFGVPRVEGAEPSAMLPYLSPEQIANGAVDASTDVFSFGVACYRMLTGALPFPEDSFAPGVEEIRPRVQPAPPERFNPEVPPRLGQIVLRCLATDRAGRFADAGELRMAFSSLTASPPPIAAVQPCVSPPPLSAPTPAPAPPAVTASATRPPAPAPSSVETQAIEIPLVEAATVDEPRTPCVPPQAPRTEPANIPGPARLASPPETKTEQHRATARARAPLDPAPRPASREPSVRAKSHSRKSEASASAAPRRSPSRRWIWAVASVVAVLVAGGTTLALFSREASPWQELPSPPEGDASVTPFPDSSPSEAVLAALLAGPSDEALFAEASAALERGDFQGSRSSLTELLGRNPEFPGAQDLLAQLDRGDAERRRAEERRRRAATPEAPSVSVEADERNEEELFYEAEMALARGELPSSKFKLETLLKINPGFVGAAELMEEIEHRLWTATLPRSFAARHNHRIGGCEGTLSLTSAGLSFRSDDHEWGWRYEDLVSMERPDAVNFYVVSHDRDLLGLLNNKRFKFELRESFGDDDWRFFQRTVAGGGWTPTARN